MSAARPEAPPATPLRAARARPEVVLALWVGAGLAWLASAIRMAGMDAGPGTALGGFGWFAGVWAVMMAAMMLPSLAPTVAAYAAHTQRREPSRWVLFAGAYLAVWSVAGGLAYGLFELGRATLAGPLAWHAGGRWLAATVLVLAVGYELTPLKRACLTRCRDPRQLWRSPRPAGWPEALAMGARSGWGCICCSWALMLALFALGVMSLTWMAVVAGLLLAQKLTPWPRAAALATAIVLIALAIGIVIAPGHVPGLVVPGSGPAMTMPGMT